MSPDALGGSFRDPSGFVYERDGVLLRQVNPAGARHYDALMQSGVYAHLTERGWLVAHEEVASPPDAGASRTLRPERIPYVSYPYEWCFDQLRDAARLTLDIQLACLERGVTLRDASAFNVQFVGRRPVFIDTLSFETYRDGVPWVAYRQYCQHFLAPLALMSHVDRRLRQLLVHHLDGIPLDLASRVLPGRTRLRYGLLAHVHLHAASQRRHQGAAAGSAPVRIPTLPKARLVALLHSLRAAVDGCRPPGGATEWGDYYQDTNYSESAMQAKLAIVAGMVDAVIQPGDTIHDLGANTGRFSRLVSGPGRYVVAHDVDDLAVERHYRALHADGHDGVLPLLLDLTNPSPALGWAHDERRAAMDRLAGGTVLALALVHHLAISNNVPLDRLAGFFARIAPRLVVEFVPKEDSQVRRLLATREDVFPDYTVDAFEAALARHYVIERREAVPESSRTLFAARRRR
ncbi:MAG: hypothetical protein R2752_20535 [Vicinamibacterales bacterium]